MNNIIYFDREVPEYYVKGSRDFQVLARLLTFALNSAKVSADSLLYLNDPILTSNTLLALMQTKVGFWSNYTFTDDEIRIVCDCFNLAVRKKGSREGIVDAIQIFLRTISAATKFDIFIQNKDIDGNDVYKIEIGINDIVHDYTLLEEILKYILPTGYTLSIYYYDLIEFFDKSILYSDYLVGSVGDQANGSKIRNQYYTNDTNQWKYLGIRNQDIDAVIEIGNDPNYIVVWSNNPPNIDLGNNSNLVFVANNELNIAETVENVLAQGNTMALYRANDEWYNGIQSIDITVIGKDNE